MSELKYRCKFRIIKWFPHLGTYAMNRISDQNLFHNKSMFAQEYIFKIPKIGFRYNRFHLYLWPIYGMLVPG